MDVRRIAASLSLAIGALAFTACGSSTVRTPPAAAPSYPAARGPLVDHKTATALADRLTPRGVPGWATPPADTPRARIAIRRSAGRAVVVPFRSGRGWCLTYLRQGFALDDWCTPATGSSHAVEGGVIFLDVDHFGLLARARADIARLVVRLASGRRIAVALRRGVALTDLRLGTAAGDRPVSLIALDAHGRVQARRSLGWTAARWRFATRPDETAAALIEKAKAAPPPTAPCVGVHIPKGAHLIASETITYGDRKLIHPTFVPASPDPLGGTLFIDLRGAAGITLVDSDGTQRPVALGPSRCAYMKLTARDRAAPFRLVAHTATGRVLEVARPRDWTSFPTDGA